MRAVNLIPAEQRKGASVGLGRSKGGAYALLVVAGALALMIYSYGKAHHQIATRRAQIATIDAQVQQAQSDAGSLAQYEALNTRRERRVKEVEQLVDSRFDWAHALHEFGRVLPAGVSISSLSGAVGGSGATGSASSSAVPSSSAASSAAAAASSVTSATPPGSVPNFQLGGCARSQAEVAQTLERLRLIDGVKEVSLQSSASSGSSTGGGSCPGTDPVFTATITFAPLPPESAYAATPVADRAAAGAEEGRLK